MDVIESLKWRYATKKFNSEKRLSIDKISILKEAFNLTATSFGLQTIKLIIVEDRGLREQLVEHSYHQRQVVDASHLLVICIEDDIESTDVDMHFNNLKAIRETPETILEPFRKDLKQMMNNMTVQEQQQWSKHQAYIALGNLMTVCALEKIDSCPMEGFTPEAYDKLLNLNKLGLKSVLLLPVGYRAEDDLFSTLEKVRIPIDKSVITIK